MVRNKGTETRFNKIYAHSSKTEQASEIAMTQPYIVIQYKQKWHIYYG